MSTFLKVSISAERAGEKLLAVENTLPITVVHEEASKQKNAQVKINWINVPEIPKLFITGWQENFSSDIPIWRKVNRRVSLWSYCLSFPISQISSVLHMPCHVPGKGGDGGHWDNCLATHFDVAVIRCLFVSRWSEDGIFWAVTYLHRR